ncbi:glycosyltransferase [Photobacterium piscicola]|uniref:Glycosyltransferase n=1 Tax=Photobacterium piscicola TaxID=1378299 RepID=A0ABU6LEZ9_9GAMM|nr:glycosyltransferase [Photobacterium piscicola]
MNDFSVLLSLYKGESPEFFNQALHSLYIQNIKSSDIVIVHDGPLTFELYEVLKLWKIKLPITEVILKNNLGLGMALNEGLKYCKYDLVARVDTDDINIPTRFEQQYQYMKEHEDIALCGSHIDEFDTDPLIITSQRKVPINTDLNNSIFKRNPINHMTVMFRKDAVLNAGGYQHLRFMEDYFLWVRMYVKGYKLVNLDTVLVKARTGNGMLERRKGIDYYRSELTFMNKVLKMDVKNKPKIMVTFLIRSHIRLLPKSALKKVYQLVRH